MEHLKIPVTKRQLSLLKRIAKSDDRRLEDLINIVFSEGLWNYFCEKAICFNKNDDEYTEAEIKQKAINDKLLLDNPKFHFLTSEEKKAQGYVYVDTSFDNYNRDDNIIEKLSEEIKNNALNEIKKDHKETEENIIKENTPGQPVKTFISTIDNCKIDYFIFDNILSYRTEGDQDWQDFIPNDRCYTDEQKKEFNQLLNEVKKDD